MYDSNLSNAQTSTRERHAMQTARMLADRAERGLPIEWSPALSVGMKSIDAQHRVLIAQEPLIYSEVPPAMDGRPANQARKCLIRQSSNRTCAGRGVGWQVQDGLVQTFPYANQLSNAISREQSASVLGQVLSGLEGYTKIHFRHEERLFKTHGWEEGLDHADTHRAFERQIADFQQRFASGDASLATAVMKFMMKWLAEHILLDDMAYSPFLREHGVH
jgi:hemerythrin-like metal-binding protein